VITIESEASYLFFAVTTNERFWKLTGLSFALILEEKIGTVNRNLS